MAQNIYKKPIFLNSVIHKSVKVAPVVNYKFGKELNSVVIVGQEFLEAAKTYPVVFVKGKNSEIIPVAILGLRNDENLFVDEEGVWKEGAYVPAFFRRYPFILASNVGEDGSFAVCCDSQHEGFDKKEGMTLFDEEGNQSEEFKKVVEFLKNYQVQNENTREMIKSLEENKLFKDISANITLPAGEKLGFGGMMMVDEMAILQLEDDKILNLVRKGFLAWVYAHLYSLSNFRSLMSLASLTETGSNVSKPDSSEKKTSTESSKEKKTAVAKKE